MADDPFINVRTEGRARLVRIGGGGQIPPDLLPDLSELYAPLVSGKVQTMHVPDLAALAAGAQSGPKPTLSLSSPTLAHDVAVALADLGLIDVTL